jgi:glutaminyl-tRNA synthetase
MTQDSASSDFIRELVSTDIETDHFGRSVMTRFPPAPNGYLHLGHAKAICLNFSIADEFDGVCNLRFDDTNPETEREDYVDGIIEDIGWLGYTSANPVRYASDYFPQLYEWARTLIKKGLAFVDDQDAATISTTRGSFTEPGVNSPWRDRSIDDNLELFAAMRDGDFADGSKVLRAKIDMAHENMQLRDPVLYRIRSVPHHRTGTDWCIYPTYDWAHGQSDAIEGITHSLCSLEFDAHRPLYDWLLDNIDLEITPPRQSEFARLNLTHTVTSKRKLAELVEAGLVDGWDDPRMPTLAGIRKRGYPAESIREFCSHIGIARVNGVHEIELLESFVRTRLNSTALRRMAVLDPLLVTITNYPEDRVEMREAVNNPEDEAAGTREIPFGRELYIEREDFMAEPVKKFYRLAPGREVRLRYGYFITCDEVITDDDGEVVELRCSYDPETAGGNAPDGRKVKATLHWVSTAHALDARVALYDRLFSNPHPTDDEDPLESLNRNSRTMIEHAKLEPALADTQPGQVVQFERLGYFALDPDEPLLFHRTVGLRDEWARIQKRASS